MRISDWSSDVCSSDLFRVAAAVKEAPVIGIERAIPTLAWTLALVGQAVVEQVLLEARKALDQVWRLAPQVPFVIHENQNLLDGCVFPDEGDQVRSEERRVGTACVSTCISRGSTYH